MNAKEIHMDTVLRCTIAVVRNTSPTVSNTPGTATYARAEHAQPRQQQEHSAYDEVRSGYDVAGELLSFGKFEFVFILFHRYLRFRREYFLRFRYRRRSRLPRFR